jgi:hypothetical protein
MADLTTGTALVAAGAKDWSLAMKSACLLEVHAFSLQTEEKKRT